MKITKAEIYQIDLPLIEPFIIAYHRYDSMPAVILKLYTNEGIIGYGESVPDEHVTGESVHSVVAALKQNFIPDLIGMDPCNIQMIHQMMDANLVGNGAAKAAVDIACYDILGKQSGLPIYTLLGGRKKSVPSIPRVLSILEPEVLAQQATEAVKEGYTEIKMKLGTNPVKDVARVKAVREAVGEDVLIRVDVNQGWQTVQQAKQTIRQLEPYHLSWVEQPIAQSAKSLFRNLRETTTIPLMADESMINEQDLRIFIHDQSVDYVNIKLMKSGGIYPAFKLATQAELFGIQCQIGSMVESSVASAAGFHVALAKENIISTEISGPTKFSEEIGNLTYQLPFVNVPELPGLGIEVNEAKLEALTIKKEVFDEKGNVL